MDPREAQAYAGALTASIVDAVSAGNPGTAREILRLVRDDHPAAAAAAWDAMLDVGGPQWLTDHMTDNPGTGSGGETR